MPIEKNIKNTPETGISGENKTVMRRLKNLILNHRLNSRQKVILNPVNLGTVVTFLPLALGFSQFLIENSRLNKTFGKTDWFFEKNLPVFTQFNPKLNFETIDYIAKSNTRFKLQNTNLSFGQSTFLTTLKKTKFAKNPNLSEITCNFYFLPSGNDYRKTSYLNQIARNLDTLPAYLEGFHQKQEIGKNKNFLFSKPHSTNVRPVDSGQSLNDKKLLKKNLKTHTKNFSINSNSTTKLTLIKKFQGKNTLPSTTEKIQFDSLVGPFSKFYKNRLEFYKTQKLVTKEIQSLFAQKNISFSDFNSFDKISINTSNSISEITLKNILSEHTDLNDEILVEAILQEIDKNKIADNLQTSRLMSGYKYPDMSNDDLYWFSIAKFGHEKNLRNFRLEPTTFSSKNFLSGATNREYDFNLKHIPNLPVTITQVVLSNPNSAQLFYKGSAIVLDSERALDWKPRSNYKENLRAWFHNYISPLNSLIQPLENFFGVYNSPKFLSESQNLDSDYFVKKPLFYETWMTNGNLSGPIQTAGPSSLGFSPFLSSFHLPFQTVSSKNSFLKTLEIDFSKNQDTNQFITIPILKIDQPFLNKNGQGSNQLNFESYYPYFNFISKGNPDYNFFRDSRKSFITKKFSGRYFKIGSIFSKTSSNRPINLDNWEPLTSRSWLIITQLSFAIFIFQVLKSLAENYGRELLGYLLDLVASLGILDDSLKQEIEILMGQRDKGFRVVLESRKNFKDIVGIQRLLPEIYEVVWFLRNSAREFALSKTLPRGILLTGPPGTGKTLLVQALAGEAQVPVIVLSGSSLIEPGESGALKLELVFQEARQLAPCIVFIDEIDTLAQKRSGVVQNPMGPDELLESLTSFEKTRVSSDFERKKLRLQSEEGSKIEDKSSDKSSEQDQLRLLTQFLIELDGIQGRDGVIVIGATNRPEVLDPALLRPGRFDKILQVGLPDHQKRIEILQFYGKSLGYETEIPWNYLADRTAGFTAADLATLMNESTIKAILTQTNHTIETIEHGIDRLTTSENEKSSLFKLKSLTNNSKNSSLTIVSKMSILRLAYYQAGKIVLSSLLENHPKSVMASLWPRRPTIRSAQIATNLQNSIFEFSRLSEITDRLVGCYSGKAAEVLFIQQFSSSKCKYEQFSTLGLEDLLFAQKLITYVLEKSIFYSKKSYIQEKTFLSPNINFREFRKIPEKIDFYNDIVEAIEIPPMQQALEKQTSSLGSKKTTEIAISSNQIYYSIPWWQQKISSELEFVEKNFTNWSRFYLSNPEQNDRNPEWLPPDEFYHTSSGLKNVKKAFANLSTKKNQQNSQLSKASTSNLKQRYLPSKADFSWNEVAHLTKDYPGHSLILQSFNKALVLLNENRELLDRVVIELLSREILRQPEIEILLEDFNFENKKSPDTNFEIGKFPTRSSNFESNQKFQIVESSWGSKSRKALPRWIDFEDIAKETT